jgi:hypothetical protein
LNLEVNLNTNNNPVQFHDFHLTGYLVADSGATVTLHLSYDYSGKPKEESFIQFSEVAAYHFIHTGGAIIAEIYEEPMEDLFLRIGSNLAVWWRCHGGYVHWDDNLDTYRAKLKAAGYHAWAIDSAIGFEGFIIAKAIAPIHPGSQFNAGSYPTPS